MRNYKETRHSYRVAKVRSFIEIVGRIARERNHIIECFLGCETRERKMSFADAKSRACEEDRKIFVKWPTFLKDQTCRI